MGSSIAAGPLIDFAPLIGNFSQMSVNYVVSTGANTLDTNASSSRDLFERHGPRRDIQGQRHRLGPTSVYASVGILGWHRRRSRDIRSEHHRDPGLRILLFFHDSFAPELPSESDISSYTSSSSFHVVNQSSATFGPTTMDVTNYAARSLPATVSTCSGVVTLTDYAFQTGTMAGTSFPLVTSETFQGSVQSASATQSLDLELRLLSVAKA